MDLRVCTVTATGHVGFPVHLDKIKGGMEHARFRNQRTLLVPAGEDRQANVKVFANGKVQVTGLRSPDDVDGVLSRLSTDLESAAADAVHQPPSARVSMMNVNFSSGAKVPLHELHHDLQDTVDVVWCAFEPMLHPAVQVQATSFKAFVFSSGTVMLFGTKSIDQAQAAASTVMGWLRSVRA